MANKGLLRGSKFNRRHHTTIPDAKDFLIYAKSLPDVTKISIGIIEPCKTGERRIKVIEEGHALRVQVRGTHAVQTFYVYGTNLNAVATKFTNLSDY